MKLATLLALSALVGVAHGASCPNSCSGHGTCDMSTGGSAQCTCYLEGKALYLNAEADPTAGWQRGVGGEETTSTSDYRRAVIELTGAAATALGDGTITTTATAGFNILDGGAGYLYGRSDRDTACVTTGTGGANQVANGCPQVGIDQTEDSTVCTVTVSSAGAITLVECLVNAGITDATAGTVYVSAPSYDAWDHQTPQAQWTGPDCSLMTCPRGMSWIKVADLKDVNNRQHTHEDQVECSDGGVCDRGSGKCNCNPGFEGSACQRTSCPDGCSGHGVCQSNIRFAKDAGARFLNSWDSGKEFGCKCDSGYRGLDCKQKECPSDDDPLDYQGNDQGRDCSGRGICDYSSGTCQCFPGFTGNSCNQVQALA